MPISKAGIGDIETIQMLAYATWPVAYKDILSLEQLQYMLELMYSRDALQQQMQESAHRFILFRDHAGTPAGFASYSSKSLNGEHKGRYRLHKLYVLPAEQGKGTGKQLLDHMIDDILSAKGTVLELNVNRHNKAVHFYTNNGFVITREEDIHIGNGFFMNDYVMEKTLATAGVSS